MEAGRARARSTAGPLERLAPKRARPRLRREERARAARRVAGMGAPRAATDRGAVLSGLGCAGGGGAAARAVWSGCPGRGAPGRGASTRRSWPTDALSLPAACNNLSQICPLAGEWALGAPPETRTALRSGSSGPTDALTIRARSLGPRQRPPAPTAGARGAAETRCASSCQGRTRLDSRSGAKDRPQGGLAGTESMCRPEFMCPVQRAHAYESRCTSVTKAVLELKPGRQGPQDG